MPQSLRAFAPGAADAPVQSVIHVFLQGGLSHIDTWDLKPGAPAEIRGTFQPISTVVPGTQISELLPRCASVVDKMTILRSHSHADNAQLAIIVAW